MPVWIWITFIAFIVILLAVDLFVNRHPKEISIKNALLQCAFWTLLSLGFGVGLYFWQGGEAFLSYLAGYTIEYALSIDNLFVFVLIFQYFAVPSKYTHRVLFFGILGAIVMRAIFILFGVLLIGYFSWILYVFALILFYGSWKMWRHANLKINPEKNVILRLCSRFFGVTENYHGEKFVVRMGKQLCMTPLFVVLICVETTDLVFALDSIPAIFAITLDPFIIFTSNIFAILGLRSLYFVLFRTLGLFCYLNYGLSVTLFFVALKMIAHDFFTVPVGLSLIIIVLLLGASIAASLLFPPKLKK
jgi:tellurite resistance protein TerC